MDWRFGSSRRVPARKCKALSSNPSATPPQKKKGGGSCRTEKQGSPKGQLWNPRGRILTGKPLGHFATPCCNRCSHHGALGRGEELRAAPEAMRPRQAQPVDGKALGRQGRRQNRSYMIPQQVEAWGSRLSLPYQPPTRWALAYCSCPTPRPLHTQGSRDPPASDS
jgi:hypothetical protein